MNEQLVNQIRIVRAMLDEFPKLRAWVKGYLTFYHPDEKGKMTVNVLVGQYQGLVEEVSVHLTDEGAEKAFLKFTDGMTLEELEKREKENFEEKYGCTRIFEVEVKE